MFSSNRKPEPGVQHVLEQIRERESQRINEGMPNGAGDPNSKQTGPMNSGKSAEFKANQQNPQQATMQAGKAIANAAGAVASDLDQKRAKAKGEPTDVDRMSQGARKPKKPKGHPGDEREEEEVLGDLANYLDQNDDGEIDQEKIPRAPGAKVAEAEAILSEDVRGDILDGVFE